MGGCECHRSLGDQCLDLGRVHVERVIDIAEHGNAESEHDGRCRGEEADGGADHLSSRPHSYGGESRVQRGGAGAEPDGVLSAEGLASHALKRLDFGLCQVGVVVGQERPGAPVLLLHDCPDTLQGGRRQPETLCHGEELLNTDLRLPPALYAGDGLQPALESQPLNRAFVRGCHRVRTFPPGLSSIDGLFGSRSGLPSRLARAPSPRSGTHTHLSRHRGSLHRAPMTPSRGLPCRSRGGPRRSRRRRWLSVGRSWPSYSVAQRTPGGAGRGHVSCRMWH